VSTPKQKRGACREDVPLPASTMAFPPIIDIDTTEVHAHEALELAAQLGMESLLSINFLPNAVYQPAACLRKTFEAAERTGLPVHHLMFEVTGNEPARDVGHLQSIFNEYKRHGMITAIDDFGAGHSGLNMLADFQPDVPKIDMALTRAALCSKAHPGVRECP
jgi:EAL domain-containing protein (putative c-di-GMP-specific phosphodiesterase class I)